MTMEQLLLINNGKVETILDINSVIDRYEDISDTIEKSLRLYFKYDYTPKPIDIKKIGLNMDDTFDVDVYYCKSNNNYEIYIHGENNILNLEAVYLGGVKKTLVNR